MTRRSPEVTPRSGARPSWSRRTRRAGRCPARPPSRPAAGAKTRLTLSAALICSALRSALATPDRSIALTSRCPASQGASSAVKPVSRLTTPPGRSEVASTSASETAGSGRSWEASTTATLPVAITGASTRHETEQARLLRRDHPDDAGRLGDGEVEVRAGDRVGAAGDLRVLVRPPGVVDPAVDGVVDLCPGRGGRAALGVGTSAANWSRRPSSISATRYSTWPRLYAVAPDHPGEGLAGRDDGVPDILARGLRGMCQQLAVGPDTG